MFFSGKILNNYPLNVLKLCNVFKIHHTQLADNYVSIIRGKIFFSASLITFLIEFSAKMTIPDVPIYPMQLYLTSSP